MHKVKPTAKLEKIHSRWDFDIFVGVRSSGEVWVAVKGKILSARSVRGIPVEHMWGEDCVSWVDRVPWNRYKEALYADGEMLEDDGKRWYSEFRAIAFNRRSVRP